MTDPLDDLVNAVHRIHDPRSQALDAFSTAVANMFRVASAVDQAFAESAKRPGGDQALALRLADVTARHRQLRGRMQDKYGDLEAMADRLAPRGAGLSARVWS